MDEQQLCVEPAGEYVLARLRGKCDEDVIRECHERVIALIRQTRKVKVLYDTREMEDATVDMAVLQQKMDSEAWKKYGPVSLRRAILVSSTRIAFLSRLAFGQFGEGAYRVFYDDMEQAVQWLDEKT